MTDRDSARAQFDARQAIDHGVPARISLNLGEQGAVGTRVRITTPGNYWLELDSSTGVVVASFTDEGQR